MVRIRPGVGGVLPSTDAAASPTGTRPAASAPPAAAPVATTTGADRTRLGGAGAGSSIRGVLRGVDPALLAPFRAPIRKALEAIALASPSAGLTAALEAIAAHPQAEQIAVMALTGRRASRVDAHAVARFGAPTVAREDAIAALTAWHRRDVATAALTGHHHHICDLLEPALLAEPDPARARRAAATLTTLAETAAGSYRVAGLLRGAGCLPLEGDWRTHALLPGSDAIGALASCDADDALAFDDPAKVAHVETRMATLFASEKWLSRSDLATHRGALGEALRMDAVTATLSADKSVVQGILVLDAPPELWNAPDAEAARVWARANGIEASHLHRTVDDAGTSHWGRLLTEIDVAVFEARPDGRLRPLRFENVKAGVNSAKKAREQNAIASRGWSDPAVHYLFPKDGGGHREPPLDRSAAASSGLASVSVGPSDDPRYDVPLALSAHDLTALAMHHT